MGKVVVTEFVTLDGVMQDPGTGDKRPGGFEHAGWAFEFKRGPEGDKIKLDELLAADVQLLGRVTWEGFARAWPQYRTTTGPFGELMNAMPKYVVSNTLADSDATWENSKVIRGDVRSQLEQLKKNVKRDILVAGSAELVRSLTEYGLVDVYRLMVYPIVLGSGKRLFEGGIPTKLRLVESTPIGSDGVLVLTYEPKS